MAAAPSPWQRRPPHARRRAARSRVPAVTCAALGHVAARSRGAAPPCSHGGAGAARGWRRGPPGAAPGRALAERRRLLAAGAVQQHPLRGDAQRRPRHPAAPRDAADPPERLPLRLQPHLHRGRAAGRHPAHAADQAGRPLLHPPRALQPAGRRRHRRRLGQLRARGRCRRSGREPGGRGPGQRLLGAGGGHLPGAQLPLPQLGAVLVVVGDGGCGAGGGLGLPGADAGRAQPPPGAAPPAAAAAAHAAKLFLPPAAPRGPPPGPGAAAGARPRCGAGAGAEVEGAEAHLQAHGATRLRLLRGVLQQPGAAGAALLPRVLPDPQRAVPMVPVAVPRRRLRLALVSALLPLPPHLGAGPAAGRGGGGSVRGRGRPVPARAGRRLRAGAAGGAAGGHGLRERLPQRAGRVPPRGAGAGGGRGLLVGLGRDRAGGGGGAGRAPSAVPRPLTTPTARTRPSGLTTPLGVGHAPSRSWPRPPINPLPLSPARLWSLWAGLTAGWAWPGGAARYAPPPDHAPHRSWPRPPIKPLPPLARLRSLWAGLVVGGV